ncbi:hypothetical protein C7460_10661 [Marinoscillum furvescens DSM 4134]|uniref:Uncharacterized protein n=1 Tax=Marinoscillum furvescens DSM 4134 TaxID=1122208 RepID=A0A3D9L5N8_MARFU|nr:hypothetical protein C7460_10661 [Marinoscillum furvescens DSM 4134]
MVVRRLQGRKVGCKYVLDACKRVQAPGKEQNQPPDDSFFQFDHQYLRKYPSAGWGLVSMNSFLWFDQFVDTALLAVHDMQQVETAAQTGDIPGLESSSLAAAKFLHQLPCLIVKP